MELVFYARFIRGRNDDPSKLEMDEAELEDYFDGEDGERNEFTREFSLIPRFLYLAHFGRDVD